MRHGLGIYVLPFREFQLAFLHPDASSGNFSRDASLLTSRLRDFAAKVSTKVSRYICKSVRALWRPGWPQNRPCEGCARAAALGYQVLQLQGVGGFFCVTLIAGLFVGDLKIEAVISGWRRQLFSQGGCNDLPKRD